MFIVHMKDGRTLKESDGVDWNDIPMHEITSLQLCRNGKYFTVGVKGENVKLLQLKRGTVGTFINMDVIERVIGFIIRDEQGNEKYAIKMEVDEQTSNVLVTLEKKEGKKWLKM